jgi:L-arabinose isomerase
MGHDGPGHVAIAQEQPTLRALSSTTARAAPAERRVQGPLRPVTIVGCTQTADGRLKLLAAEGESIPGETFRIGNTNSRLRFGQPPAEFLRALVRAGPDAPRRARASATSRATCRAGRAMLDLEYAEVG